MRTRSVGGPVSRFVRRVERYGAGAKASSTAIPDPGASVESRGRCPEAETTARTGVSRTLLQPWPESPLPGCCRQSAASAALGDEGPCWQQGRVSGLRALLPIAAAENNESQKSLTRPSAQTQPTLGHPVHIAWSAIASVKQVEVNVRLCTIPESVYTLAFPDQPGQALLADPDAEARSGNFFPQKRLHSAAPRPSLLTVFSHCLQPELGTVIICIYALPCM